MYTYICCRYMIVDRRRRRACQKQQQKRIIIESFVTKDSSNDDAMTWAERMQANADKSRSGQNAVVASSVRTLLGGDCQTRGTIWMVDNSVFLLLKTNERQTGLGSSEVYIVSRRYT